MPLNIINDDQKDSRSPITQKSSNKLQMQAKWERKWLENKDKYDPSKNALENVRLERSWELLRQAVPSLEGKIAADVGCGTGDFAIMLCEAGAQVHALEISANALKILREHNNPNCHIEIFQEYLPQTKREDDLYDILACLDVIANLPVKEYRLSISELSRLIKPDGVALLSSPLDIHSEDALQYFANLVEIEFEITAWKFSYNYLFINLCDFFDAPRRFVKGTQNQAYRESSLEKRSGFFYYWYKWNSSTIVSYFWRVIEKISRPIHRSIIKNKKLLLILEKWSKWLWDDRAITHVILLGKRKGLQIPSLEEIQVEVRKGKREVWE